jgi:serine/threonine protein kinase/class 3 adenylate cyclase
MDPPAPVPDRARVEEFRRKHHTGLVTLVFTDLVDSVALRRHLGDQAATTLLQTQRQLVRNLLQAFVEAEEIETAGDSFLLLFARPSDAVKFALLMQHQTRALARERSVALADRIGIHVGEVVIEEHGQGPKPKDLYGSQIDLCARVMSLAEGGQVLLTSAVFDTARQAIKGEELPGLKELQWLNHGPYVLKGIEEEVTICEVGEVGMGIFKAPVGSEKARRKVSAQDEPVLGWRPALGQTVPNTQWVLERKLGEGGFGEVWLGRHQKLKERRVFKFCFRADRVRSLKREMTLFRVLKERVGDHPNIVRLLEVYFEEPPFYVVMDHVEGRDLKGWCKQHGGAEKVALQVRLEIVAQIADALQAAHDAGVIHRDVKPGNILVSDPGPVSSDQLSFAGDRGSGVKGQKLQGEPEFVASDSPVLTRQSPPTAKLTDFGIGQVISEEALKGVTKTGFTETLVADSSSSHTGSQMYMAPELLAGKPASIRSDIYSLGVVLYQLLVGDLTHPVTTDWANEISDPLLSDDLRHCFVGNPNERFAGAGQLAKQLRGLQQRQAALARQQAELAARERAAYRRGVVRATSLAAVILAVVTGLGVLAWKEAQRAVAGELAARRNLYAADMIRASQALAESNLGQAVRLLDKYNSTMEQKALRGWEWSYLWGQTRSDELFQLGPHSKTIHSMAYSPNGRFVVSGSRDRTTVVWDVEGRRKLAVLQHSNTVISVAFSPDGTLATLENRGTLVRLWDPVTGYQSCDALVVKNQPSSLAFSPDGKTLAVATTDRVPLWDVSTRREKASIAISGGRRLTFSPNGQILAVAREDGSVVLWNLSTDSKTGSLSGFHEGNSGSLAFSPDGRRLAGASGEMQPTVWNVATLKQEAQLTNHHSWVGYASFSRDGSRLATASADQTVKIWDTATWRETASLSGHLDEVWTVAFSPTSDILATGSKDGLIKFWSPEPPTRRPAKSRLATTLTCGRCFLQIAQPPSPSTRTGQHVSTG